ncbi:serine hydrolase domain-containing protein [Dermabacteraceae bacterium P13115]
MSELSPEISERIDALFREAVSSHATSGLAYGVVGADGSLLHSGGAGHSQLVAGEPAAGAFVPGKDSISRIASMSKSFIAASILKLRDEGRLRLDDPVSNYLPEVGTLALPSEDSPALTLRLLLTMSAGLVTDNPWGDRQEAMTAQAFREMIAGGLGFMSVPGTAFEYSNASYVMLGQVIGEVAGVGYEDYVRENFLRPLGMNDTDYERTGLDPERIVTGHRLNEREDALRFEPVEFDSPGVYGAMAGLYSTVADVSRWVRFLSSANAATSEHEDAGYAKLLSRASRREMQQGYRLQRTPVTREGQFDRLRAYGMGLVVEEFPLLGGVISHSGGYPGFGSFMCWHRDSGIGVIVLANSKYAPAPKLSYEVLEVLRQEGQLRGSAGLPLAEGTKRGMAAAIAYLRSGDAAVADEWFSDNMDLDVSREERMRRRAVAEERTGVSLDGEWPEPTVLTPFEVRWDFPRVADKPGLRVHLLMDPRVQPLMQSLTLITLSD